MVLWNLLDGWPSRSRLLLGPSKSMWSGTPDTNPRQHRSSKRTTLSNTRPEGQTSEGGSKDQL
jgi:hypothetical protein